MSAADRIWVTGHRGLLGSAVVRRLKQTNASILTCDRQTLDVRDVASVARWVGEHRPTQIIHCAGTVGGIWANSQRPVDFFNDNCLMHISVLSAAHRHQVQKLLYVGSSCIYPRECPQPIREEYLLTDSLEPTNAAYALAKISGVMSCQFYREQHGCNFISAMPTNLYGPNDNFDLKTSHVLPALIRRFHEAKLQGDSEVVVWGSGRPRREFMHVDDLADACLFLLQNYDDGRPINVGTGIDLTIAELADLVRYIVYPEVHVRFDSTKPDGTLRKVLDVSRIHELGWSHTIELQRGLRQTYDWFAAHYQAGDIRLGTVTPS
ncbi:MAG: GDP-L-fucose synthase [Planctomycetales bacterium]|nr:GDP-L-fucose synthase [Planctomycetales bacterium]MCA9166427.1 GDP-L-fucose synthase [Planctomycetales bacterium]